MFKNFMCFCMGHDWSDTTQVALTVPAIGVGTLVCKRCSRCGKEVTNVDFSSTVSACAAHKPKKNHVAKHGKKEEAPLVLPNTGAGSPKESKAAKGHKPTASNKA